MASDFSTNVALKIQPHFKFRVPLTYNLAWFHRSRNTKRQDVSRNLQDDFSFTFSSCSLYLSDNEEKLRSRVRRDGLKRQRRGCEARAGASLVAMTSPSRHAQTWTLPLRRDSTRVRRAFLEFHVDPFPQRTSHAVTQLLKRGKKRYYRLPRSYRVTFDKLVDDSVLIP